MRYDDKNVLIVGYGESGKAVDRFLNERGANTIVYDDFLFPSLNITNINSIDFAVVSPGVSIHHSLLSKLRAKRIPILSEIDLAYINCKAEKIFAVSGTNGKTTVCTILGDMLAEKGNTFVLGNVGVPFVSKVSEIGGRDLVVLEISSFQIEQSVVFKPFAACLTNVGEDHLDRHKTKENYRSIKLNLLKNAEISVKNEDDIAQSELCVSASYGFSEKADYRWENRSIVCPNARFDLPELSRGKAYDIDFLCAFAIASTAFSPCKSFLNCYGKTKVPSFRNEYVGTFCGAKVFNDSKGTNIDATVFACSLQSESTALILGGSDKGENYARLSKLPECIERIYLIGANAADIFASVDQKTREKCLPMRDLEDCLKDFSVRPLSVLLFSPASASFDRYSGYRERGERFNALLEKYGATLVR